MSTTTGTITRARAKRDVMLDVYDFLKEVCIKSGEGRKYAEYKDDWTDLKVAEKFGVSHFTVRDLRFAKFGRISPSTLHGAENKRRSTAARQARLTAMEQRITHLESVVARLAQTHYAPSSVYTPPSVSVVATRGSQQAI